jgi:DNA-binding MarR family transcriptional regulator
METVSMYSFLMSQPKGAVKAVSDLKKHAGFWLRFVSNHVSHAFARKLLDSGVTVAEWVVLREMYGQAEMSSSELADRIGMTRGAISKLVDRLVGKTLVTRQDRSDDRRFQDIALTPAGQRLVPSLAALADQNDEEFFHPLSAKERETMIATLKKLVQAHGLHKLPTE